MAVRKRIIDVLQEKAGSFRLMVKCGILPIHYLNYYEIYCFYSTLHNIEKKMDRYSFTAETLKTNEQIVMRAIKEMEREVDV